MVIARRNTREISPLLAPVYLACGLLQVEVADVQRFALHHAVLMAMTLLLSTGPITLAPRPERGLVRRR
ncbi:hypothetical protein [Alteriqipengyuania sp.]|uniref:hypothetical protein n=1 Tax=Alteriqipengyuania sp. TaxID=2800692 RepID=UPI0035148C23